MDLPRLAKLRWLYLLALVQLLGGPLVLLHVTMFCGMTARVAPRLGIARAAADALWAADFNAAALVADGIPNQDRPEPKLEKHKQPSLPWKSSPALQPAAGVFCKVADQGRTWTPAWPNAPPGPPPRLG